MNSGNTISKNKEEKRISSKPHNGKVGFLKAVKLFYINYFDFRSRASVSEYWWVFLYYAVTYAPIMALVFFVPPLGAVLYLSMIIPGISLAVRRLHDMGRSGFWYLISFIPIAGSIIIISELCRKSDDDNRWGPGPLLHEGEIVTNATVRSEAMKLIPSNAGKSEIDKAVSLVIPTYTGKENLEKAAMLCDPIEVSLEIARADNVTLALLLSVFDRQISRQRSSEMVRTYRDSVLSILKSRLFEGEERPSWTDTDIPLKSEKSYSQNRSQLTNAVIEKELHAQKHSPLEYVGQAVLGVITVIIAVFYNFLILILGVFLILNVLRMIKDDIKRTKMKYYLLERTCIEKKIAENDDGEIFHQLWFSDITGEYNVAITISQDFYDATEIGEEFYIVVLFKDATPSLCYRKSEWVK